MERRNEQTATHSTSRCGSRRVVHTKITDEMLNFSVLSVVFFRAFPFLRVIRAILQIHNLKYEYGGCLQFDRFGLVWFHSHWHPANTVHFENFYLLRNYCKSTKARDATTISTHTTTSTTPIQSIIFFIEHFKRIDIFASSNYSVRH